MEFWKKLCKKLILFFKKILKRTVWYALGPSQQANVSPNYSQFIKINIGPSDGRTIISSSNRPMVIYLRLTDFRLNDQFSQQNLQWMTSCLSQNCYTYFFCIPGVDFKLKCLTLFWKPFNIEVWNLALAFLKWSPRRFSLE